MINVNMAKAKEIKKEMVRAEREPLFEKLDVAYMRAQETGDTVKMQDIAAKKQALRDATEDPVILDAQTPEELKLARPSALENAGVA